MTKLYKEFKASLKDIVVEEVVDLLIFRPIAYIVVKLIYRFPITPNQISVLAILTGIASGVFFAMGIGAALFMRGCCMRCRTFWIAATA